MNCEQEIYNLDSNEYFSAKIFDHLEKLDKKSNASVFRPYQEIIDDNNNRALTLDQIYKALLRGEYRNNIWFLIRDYTKALSFIVNYYIRVPKYTRMPLIFTTY
ncbi:hypothetical protein PVAND_001775 [Polypedilum vanderplanki]|uniref:Uncharacterized protein n=1 Tax=Polypedilum vanderplanki TaxID=319348 RepID=A0A9J6BQA6_POLVA|nr:hypothetical protein PVAND_001775 [Polypedilum vanderplanki]